MRISTSIRWLETGSPWEGDEMTEREQFEKAKEMTGSFCPQCEAEIPDNSPREFLLASLVFCCEACCDEWLAMRNDEGEE